MRKALLVLSLLICSYLSAQELNPGHDANHRGGRSESCSNCASFSQSTSQISSFANNNFSQGAINKSSTDSIEKEFSFKPNYNISEYRGAFTTSVNIPIPSNNLGVENLKLTYNSQVFKNTGFGVGFRASLYKITQDIITQKVFLENSHSKEEFTKISSSYLQLKKRVYSLTGQGIESHYRKRVENDFSHIIKLSNGPYQWVLFQVSGKAHIFDKYGRLKFSQDLHKNKLTYKWNQCHVTSISNEKWQMHLNYKNVAGVSFAYPLKCNNRLLKDIEYDTNHYKKLKFHYYDKVFLSKVNFEGAKKSLFKATYATSGIRDKFFSSTSIEKDHVIIPWNNSIKKFKSKTGGHYTFFIDVTGDGLVDRLNYDISPLTRPVKKLYEETREKKIESSFSLDILKVTNSHFKFSPMRRDTKFGSSVFFKSTLSRGKGGLTSHRIKTLFFDLNMDGKNERVLCEQGGQDKWEVLETKTLEVYAKAYENFYKNNNNSKVNFLENSLSWRQINLNISECGEGITKDINLDGYVDIIVSKNKVLFGSSAGLFKVNFSNNELENTYGKIYVDQEKQEVSLAVDKDFKYKKYQALQFLKQPVTGDFLKINKEGTFISHPQKDFLHISSINSDWGGRYEIKYKLESGVIVVGELNKVVNTDNIEFNKYQYIGGSADPNHFFTRGFEKVKKETTYSAGHKEPVNSQKVFNLDNDPLVAVLDTRGRYDGQVVSTTTYLPNGQKYFDVKKDLYALDLGRERIFPFVKKIVTKRYDSNEHENGMLVKTHPYQSYPWFGEGTNEYIAPKKTQVIKMGHDELIPVFSDPKSDVGSYVLSEYIFDPKNYYYRKVKIVNKSVYEQKLKHDKISRYDSLGLLIKESSGDVEQNYVYDDHGRMIHSSDNLGNHVELEYKDLFTPTPLKVSKSNHDLVEVFEFDSVFKKVLKVSFGNQDFSYSYDPSGHLVEAYKNGVLVRERNIDLSQNKIEETAYGNKQSFILNSLGFVKSHIFTKGTTHRVDYKKDPNGLVFEEKLAGLNKQSEYYFSGHIKSKKDSLGNIYINEDFDSVYGFYNKKEYDGNTIDIEGNVTSNFFLENYANFRRDYLGRIKRAAAGPIGTILKWEYDLSGRVKSFYRNQKKDYSHRPLTLVNTYENNGLTFKNALGAKYIYRADGKLMEKWVQDAQGGDYLKAQIFYKNQLGLGKKINLNANGSKFLIQKNEYNPNNQLIKTQLNTHDSSYSFNYDYDKNERLTNDRGVTIDYKNNAVSALKPYIIDIQYNSYGLISKVSYRSGEILTFAYNPLSKLIGKTLCSKKNNCRSYELTYTPDQMIKSEKLGEVKKSYDYSYKRSKTDIYVGLRGVYPRTLDRVGREKYETIEYYEQEDLPYFWSSEDMVGFVGHKIYYDEASKGVLFESSTDNVLRLFDDLIISNGVQLRKLEVEGHLLAFIVGDKLYPVLSDYRQSPAVYLKEGSENLIQRNYNKDGKYVLDCKEDCAIDGELKFDFAGLFRPFKDSRLLWSQTRVYDYHLEQWLSLDPLLYNSGAVFENSPMDWNGLSYVGNDPVNFVDPSGHAVQSVEDLVLEVSQYFSEAFNTSIPAYGEPYKPNTIAKVMTVLSTEFVPHPIGSSGNISRIIFGRDPYSGKSLSHSDRAFEIMKTATFSGVGKAFNYLSKTSTGVRMFDFFGQRVTDTSVFGHLDRSYNIFSSGVSFKEGWNQVNSQGKNE